MQRLIAIANEQDTSGVEQGAEKGLDLIRSSEKYPSGAKAPLFLLRLRHD
jgi:hypothetical protein